MSKGDKRITIGGIDYVKASKDDIPEILKMDNAIPGNLILRFKDTKEAEGFLSKTKVLFILVNDEKVGYVSYRMTEPDVEIDSLVILPEFQNKGIGSSVVETVLENVQSIGYKKAWLVVHPNNTVAVGMYKALGFKEVEVIDNYYGSEPRVKMAKSLAIPKNEWCELQIEQHKLAAQLLDKIMDETFELTRSNPEITEYEVQQFIQSRYKRYDMAEDVDPPIVAFRESTANVHYFPKKKTALKLTDGTLIMIDIWARLNQKDAPFADMTWMAWHGGEIPAEIQKGFDIILESRDKGVDFIRQCLEKGQKVSNKKIAKAMEDIVLDSGLQELIPHSYGHSLGTTSCHGIHGNFLNYSKVSMINNVGYTIEPGIYIDGKYGFRSEIDVLINENGKLGITTKVQKEIVRV